MNKCQKGTSPLTGAFPLTQIDIKNKNNSKNNLWIMWITLWITQNSGLQKMSFAHIHNAEKGLWKVSKKP